MSDAPAPEAQGSTTIRGYFSNMAKPGYLTSLMDGSPPVVKQLGQLILLLAWPVWVLLVGCAGIVAGFFWLLLYPLRAYMKKNNPEDYAASQNKRLS